jgi:cysteine desulfurase family protein (TIGR01976 family)
MTSPGSGEIFPVGEAVARTLTSAIANRGSVTAAARHAEQVVHDCRRAVADLLGADPGGIVFGRSATDLTYLIARTMSRRWLPGEEVVVTSLDHDANIRPWVQAAQACGVTVRWAHFDPQTGELPVEAVAALLGPRTRLVAVTAASNLIGTRPDVTAIADTAHAAGALVYLDAVHLVPHVFTDLAGLGADLLVCSPYKFLGPHCAVLAAAPELLAELHPDKLLPSTDEVPERFEFGTLPYELMAGTTAAVDYLAGLVASAGHRRHQLEVSFAALQAHEDRLLAALSAGLAQIDGVRLITAASRRTPTVLFTLDGMSSADVGLGLAEQGVNSPAGSFYAVEASRRLGLGDGGAVRAGLAPYTDDEDVARLIQALAALRCR